MSLRDPGDSAARPARGSGVRAASILAFLGAVGTGVLAVGHAGVEIPLISALGPGGARPVWPAAAAFTAAALAYAVVGVGLRRARTWAVPAGSALFAVTVVVALIPFRGAGSFAGAVLGIAGLALLSLTALQRWSTWVGRRRTDQVR